MGLLGTILGESRRWESRVRFRRVWRHVGVGDVLEAADARGQDEPFGKEVYIFAKAVGGFELDLNSHTSNPMF